MMQALKARSIALLAVTSILIACGGSTPPGAVLSGTVQTASGAVVANAHVIAMNRITDEEHSVMTDGQGRYRMALADGHYDVGADDGAGVHAMIYGLVSLSGAPQSLDFNLPTQRDANMVAGRLYVTGETPAVGYTLNLTSRHGATNADDVVRLSTVTDASGYFEFSLDRQRLFDLDIKAPNGALVEFIDLHKLDGALQTIIRLGDASDDNESRHDQGRSTELRSNIKVAADDASKPFTYTKDNKKCENISLEKACEQTLEHGVWVPSDDDSEANLKIYNNNSYEDVNAYTGFYLNRSEAVLTPSVNLSNKGKWFYDYKVNVFDFHKSETNIVYNASGSCYYQFTDQTTEVYDLHINFFSLYDSHYVSYNSEKPNIVNVAIQCYSNKKK